MIPPPRPDSILFGGQISAIARYSVCNALIGVTREARAAGSHTATSAMAPRITDAETNAPCTHALLGTEGLQ